MADGNIIVSSQTDIWENMALLASNLYLVNAGFAIAKSHDKPAILYIFLWASALIYLMKYSLLILLVHLFVYLFIIGYNWSPVLDNLAVSSVIRDKVSAVVIFNIIVIYVVYHIFVWFMGIIFVLRYYKHIQFGFSAVIALSCLAFICLDNL